MPIILLSFIHMLYSLAFPIAFSSFFSCGGRARTHKLTGRRSTEAAEPRAPVQRLPGLERLRAERSRHEAGQRTAMISGMTSPPATMGVAM